MPKIGKNTSGQDIQTIVTKKTKAKGTSIKVVTVAEAEVVLRVQPLVAETAETVESLNLYHLALR